MNETILSTESNGSKVEAKAVETPSKPNDSEGERQADEPGSPNGAPAADTNGVAATTTENNTITIQVRSTSPPPAEDQTDAGASVSSSSTIIGAAAITRIEINGSNIKDTMNDIGGARDGSRSELGMGDDDDDDDDASDISSVINAPSVISQTPDRYGFMGGEQYTHESEPNPPPEVIRKREMKWLTMLSHWDTTMKNSFKTVRNRCRKGIPRSVRGRAWYYLCGAVYLHKKNPDTFKNLLDQEGKSECIEDIRKDLHRQFPWHEIFMEDGHGQEDLFRVLKAYSILNEKDGYCQAQAPIAATLLMHMPAEEAFWCLVAVCDKYLKGYYSPGMEQLQLDGDILFGLLKRVSPTVYKHLKKQKIEPVLYMTEWFLCAYTRTLPWSSVLRVWDMFLCEGVKILFRVGLVLLKYTLGRTDVLKQCPNMYDTLPVLKNLPNYVTHENFMVVQMKRLDISDDQMRREHYKQVMKRKKAEKKKAKLEAAQKRLQQKEARSVSSSRQNVNISQETAL
ncbi:unnamed protein product [Orchesella dallaii]|uniref:Rab-GAP TBC domain-containing protein n=1 Tax=Orchesella dallaii TaxID=48710 RepID=A0ABP1QZ08_9HEXA